MTRFIQAKNYQWCKPGRTVKLVVIHTMEAPEKPGTAGGVASWFAGPTAPMASAHICVDNAEIVECVKPDHIAFGAPGANKVGYHIEHAGFAKQSSADWQDAYSQSMLRLSAGWAADIAKRYDIPVVHLMPDQIKAGASGFCGHVDVTHAFGTPGGHVDPGGAFPWDQYLALVADAMNAPPGESDPATAGA
jgi:N-acetyl-anhydromuramyl-L-alanine amidase AmpD